MKVIKPTCATCHHHLRAGRDWYHKDCHDLCSEHWAALAASHKEMYTSVSSALQLGPALEHYAVYCDISSLKIADCDVDGATVFISPCPDTWVLNVPTICNDFHSCYRMPAVLVKRTRANTGMTIVDNIEEIAVALRRPPMYIMKFWGIYRGAMASKRNHGDYTINGFHHAFELQEVLDVFIEEFAICSQCRALETDLIVGDPVLTSSPSACAAVSSSSSSSCNSWHSSVSDTPQARAVARPAHPPQPLPIWKSCRSCGLIESLPRCSKAMGVMPKCLQHLVPHIESVRQSMHSYISKNPHT